MNRETIAAVADLMDESLMLADDLDEAFIGVGKRCNQPTIAVYSHERIMDILVERDGMDYDEAAEFIDYNIIGGWHGPQTPLVLIEIQDKEQDQPGDVIKFYADEAEALKRELKTLNELQNMLVRELDAWFESCPKVLRRWLIGRMEKQRGIG